MNAQEFYSRINGISQEIFSETLVSCAYLGQVHELTVSIRDFSRCVPAGSASDMLPRCIEQIEYSCFSMLLGLYRQAMASLRLALEILSAAVYFSAHELEYKEWRNGSRDIIWSTITDDDNGILSNRFGKAFCPDLLSGLPLLRARCSQLYRSLSEYVHGNYATWDDEQPAFDHRPNMVDAYGKMISEFHYICTYMICTRFLESFSSSDLTLLEPHILDEIGTNISIRNRFGVPVEAQ